MRKAILLGLVAIGLAIGTTGSAFGAIIDFTGGTAYLSGGGTFVPTDVGGHMSNVDYYVENGIKVDFIGGDGIIGNYYQNVSGQGTGNSVLHAHWTAGPLPVSSIVFSKVDGSTLDLNYVEITSNCVNGGLLSDGTELSYITPLGGSPLLLPSSHWGFGHLHNGSPTGDGVAHVNFGASFDNILSFTVTSQNAYCFGMDNFYIDQAAPAIPVPGSLLLAGIGVAGVARWRRRSAGKA